MFFDVFEHLIEFWKINYETKSSYFFWFWGGLLSKFCWKKFKLCLILEKKLIFWVFCIWFKVQGRHLGKKVTLKAYPYFENKGGSFKYIFYQKVIRFSCMCSEKVILYKKWSFPFFAPLRMIFQKATLLTIFSKFHSKTILLNKSITKFFFLKDLEGKIENFQKMSISGPDLRSKTVGPKWHYVPWHSS